MGELERFFREHNGREMNADERAAAKRLTQLSAPLGLSEWKTSSGDVYYSSRSALAHQMGINRREASND